MLNLLLRHRYLVLAMVRREIELRYKGSFGGLFWYVLQNLFMLGLYSFVFGTLFRSRWVSPDESKVSFTLVLFVGLIVYNFFSENIGRSTTLIVANSNYVKKVVFPLELLPIIHVLVALFNSLIALIIFFIVALIMQEQLYLQAVWIPVIVFPLVVMTLGFMWFLASLGTFVRDVVQVVALLLMATMFLSPLFYPKTFMPEHVQNLLMLNPITFPMEELRTVILFGNLPNFAGLALYSLAAFVVATSGYAWFQKTRKGFADVI